MGRGGSILTTLQGAAGLAALRRSLLGSSGCAKSRSTRRSSGSAYSPYSGSRACPAALGISQICSSPHVCTDDSVFICGRVSQHPVYSRWLSHEAITSLLASGNLVTLFW